jgi:uncharacterized protein
VKWDWTDLAAAVAIVCILEGVVPFLSPSAMRRMLARMANLEDGQMRVMGLLSMAVGLGILYWVRS